MKIRLLAFASAADALGEHDLELELPAGSRVADLKARLDTDYPDLEPLWPRLAVAVDGELVEPDEELSDGAEVALLPPVSGGTEAAPTTALVHGPIDVPGLLAAVADPGRGAVVLFLGTVRDHHDERPVERLTYTAYRPMARTRLEAIAGDLEAADPQLKVAIVHRLGDLAPGEVSLAIACASPHRAAAYQANRSALERIKAELPVWKREHYTDGEAAWREEESLVGGASRRQR